MKTEGVEVTYSYRTVSNHLIQEHTNKEKRVVYYRVVPVFVPNGEATATAAAPFERKRKVLWYYYHSYGSHWTIHYSLHPTYNTDSGMASSPRIGSSTNIPIHYYHFVVRTNTIIYNNQQQQKREKERGRKL